MTTLVFDPGSILKMQNAALLVQNQGSALQVLGGPNSYQTVTVTSYKDSSIGGVSNGDPNSTPQAGDYGGIVFRNFSQAATPNDTTARNDLFPGQIPITGNSLEDDRLKGQLTSLDDPNSQVDAVSGADDIMSSISFLTERYAGGSVPATIGTQYDGITLLNSRPAVVSSIDHQLGSSVAGISADVDSLREDDVAQGSSASATTRSPATALNGIYIRANTGTGVAEATNAVSYPTNPSTDGGSANYVFNDPYPYLLTSRMEIGQQLQVDNFGGDQHGGPACVRHPGHGRQAQDRGLLGDIRHCSARSRSAPGLPGDPTYIHEYDDNNEINLSDPGFVRTAEPAEGHLHLVQRQRGHDDRTPSRGRR